MRSKLYRAAFSFFGKKSSQAIDFWIVLFQICEDPSGSSEYSERCNDLQRLEEYLDESFKRDVPWIVVDGCGCRGEILTWETLSSWDAGLARSLDSAARPRAPPPENSEGCLRVSAARELKSISWKSFQSTVRALPEGRVGENSSPGALESRSRRPDSPRGRGSSLSPRETRVGFPPAGGSEYSSRAHEGKPFQPKWLKAEEIADVD